MDPDPSSLNLLQEVFLGFTPAVILPIILLVILLTLSALISGSEVAFFSLKPSDIDSLSQSEDETDQLILSHLGRPKRLLATILINNNFVNVAIVVVSALISDRLFNFDSAPLLGFLIEIVTITFLILLFGEIIPKVYATVNGLGFARFMAKFLDKSIKVLSPLSSVLIAAGNLFEGKEKHRQLSMDDLQQALELTDEVARDEEEHKILQGIVRFGSTTVKEIMKPRTDIIGIEIHTDYHEVLEKVVNSGFSRLPVFSDSIDQIKGVLYIKDLLPHIEGRENFNWKILLRQPIYVPESKKIDDLLKEFQTKRIHLAIVVDEFGGTSGIVTLEDVIEEIVGDISDEFDDEDLIFSKLDESNYIFEGKTPLKDFSRVLKIDDTVFQENKGDADTLAGFILEISGKFPEKNEEIPFENYTFKIESLEDRRISQIKVTIHEEETEEEGPV